jgi:hypothetical protein
MRERTPALPDSFTPPAPQDGDEYFRNGIFFFNITRMAEDIAAGLCEHERCRTDIAIWHTASTRDPIDDEFVEQTDLTKPVIIAEISPDKLAYYPDIDPADWRLRGYHLIDGWHRVEKAHRHGIKALDACIIPMGFHIRYMYSGFGQYSEYWQSKLTELLRDSKHRAKINS